jgi:hypothetical protein
MDESERDNSEQAKSTALSDAELSVAEEAFGWKTAITYGLISIILLSLAAYAYIERATAISQQQRAELSQRRAEVAFVNELGALLTKRTALREAQSQVETLGREIESLPTVSTQDKARLSGTVGSIAAQLDDIDAQIDRANQTLFKYLDDLRTINITGRSANLSLGFVSEAHAQSQNQNATTDVKLGFAAVAFLVIVLVISYCLWMIARPFPSNASRQATLAMTADKKWAKELLNKQLVFLGGLVVGIVIKG